MRAPLLQERTLLTSPGASVSPVIGLPASYTFTDADMADPASWWGATPVKIWRLPFTPDSNPDANFAVIAPTFVPPPDPVDSTFEYDFFQVHSRPSPIANVDYPDLTAASSSFSTSPALIANTNQGIARLGIFQFTSYVVVLVDWSGAPGRTIDLTALLIALSSFEEALPPAPDPSPDWSLSYVPAIMPSGAWRLRPCVTAPLGAGENAFDDSFGLFATGAESHAEGDLCTASGFAAHAEGSGTTASASTSHAEGEQSSATGLIAHAEGLLTLASGLHAHAEGESTVASGEDSHAQGDTSQATANHADAMGKASHAYGESSHAHAQVNRAALGDAQYVRQPLAPKTGAGTVSLPSGWPANRTIRVIGNVIAREDTGTDHSAWDVLGFIKTDGSGTPTDLTAATITHVFGTSGASTWTLTFVDGTLTFALGGDGHTVHWLGVLKYVELG